MKNTILIVLALSLVLDVEVMSANADFSFGESTNLVVLLDMAMTCGLMAQVSFTRIMEGDLAQDTGPSVGCAWGDYDNDGYPDLVVADGFGALNRLYHNNGDGTFSRVREGPIANDHGDSDAAVWADYDNDGDLDLFVTNFDPPRDCFYRNEVNGVFTKVTQGDWVTDSGAGVSAAWGDYDNDGLVDLFVANSNNQNNYLYRNNGDGTMSRINTGPVISSDGSSHGCTWSDYDGDGDVDLFVACGHGEDEQQFLNNGDGSFTRVTTGHLVNSGGQGTGISCADYDNDGDLDLLVTGWGLNENRLYRNDGAVEPTFIGILGDVFANSDNAAWGDYDNDGYLDLFIVNYGQDNFLFHNNGDGTFAQVTEGALVHDGVHSLSCAWADYDNDGDLDLFVANGIDAFGTNFPPEPGFLYRNDGGTNNWLVLRLVGVASNRSAIGAKVRLLATIGDKTFWQLREVSGGSGYCSQNDLRVHFGLGDATTVESVRIEWSSGITQFLRDVPVNQLLTVEEEDPTGNNTAPRITPACPDFNGDEIVDGIDIHILIEHWGTDNQLCDIAPPPWGDGVVDVQDLIILAEHLFEGAGLVAHWALDETEGDIAHDSAGNIDAAVYNGQWAEGKIDGALDFNGLTTYMDCGDSLRLSTRKMTLSMWLEPQHMGGMRYVLSRVRERSEDFDYVLMRHQYGEIEFAVAQEGSGPVSVLSSGTAPLNEWTHVSVCLDGSEATIYINGQLDASAGYAQRGSCEDCRLWISSLGKDTRYYNGKIDDVRIYNIALSAGEIEELAR